VPFEMSSIKCDVLFLDLYHFSPQVSLVATFENQEFFGGRMQRHQCREDQREEPALQNPEDESSWVGASDLRVRTRTRLSKHCSAQVWEIKKIQMYKL
jgi:hypothetical protein